MQISNVLDGHGRGRVDLVRINKQKSNKVMFIEALGKSDK